MLSTYDTAAVQPLPRANYFEASVVVDNPWRKLFSTGTAGCATEYFCAERLDNGAPYQFVRLAGKQHVVDARYRSDIETLIELMKPSMSQLAACFGVSRQRVYDWRNGEGMSASNVDQMKELLKAVRMLSERSPVPITQAGNRKLVNGNTFWVAVASGTKPTDAANNVLTALERDQKERSALNRSLASRKIARPEEPALYSPYLSE